MHITRPAIGITMGDPVGIGPEIIQLAFCDPSLYEVCKPVVIGDPDLLAHHLKLRRDLKINRIATPAKGRYEYGQIDVIAGSCLDPSTIFPGRPTEVTGRAMIAYIEKAIGLALASEIEAVVTGPINKTAMAMAGSQFHGHTELFAARTKTSQYAMMLAGDRLKVVLVTIHRALREVPGGLTRQMIEKTIWITQKALIERFGVDRPKIAVAGLNPHAGEAGMFGDEEERVIQPAVDGFYKKGYDVSGPHPPDTVFFHAANGKYDAVVCMYHDQGLIPFKLLHFEDGVNTTLGLPIIRTSVDHGTAYDIAFKGIAKPDSLKAAIRMAVLQAKILRKREGEKAEC